jgi:hypothetical protein
MQWYEAHERFYDNWMHWGLHRWYEMSQSVGECYRHQCVIIPQLQTNIRLTHISSCSTSWVPQYQLFGSAVDFFNAIFISIHCAVQVSSWFWHLYGKCLWFHISRQIVKCTHKNSVTLALDFKVSNINLWRYLQTAWQRCSSWVVAKVV